MKQTSNHAEDENIVYAYEPDQTLRQLIGKNTPIADIFTREKIEACKQLVNEAKSSFFDTAQTDMNNIKSLINNPISTEQYAEICAQIYQPAINIKGQAEIFGFSLISQVCKYLIEYCQSAKSSDKATEKDVFIITKLIILLEKTFAERIAGSGGKIEKELIYLIQQVRK